MKITEILKIGKNSIVSIVGAGGKTSLMFRLAEELRKKGRVLVTTTTKIYVPNKEQYDYLVAEEEGCDFFLKDKDVLTHLGSEVENLKSTGIWVYGEKINGDNKLTAVSEKKLEQVIKLFDYVLIEADGSKGKPLKGWRKDEPIISSYTTCTIGVLSGRTLGLDIGEENIHRVNRFLGKAEGTVNVEDLMEVIFNPSGMFNYSKGKRVLYINQIDEEYVYKKNLDLISEIINENWKNGLLNQVIIGSTKNKNYINMDLGGQDG